MTARFDAVCKRVAGQSLQRQEAASGIYHVIKDEGIGVIDGKRFEVKQGHTFAFALGMIYDIQEETYL